MRYKLPSSTNVSAETLLHGRLGTGCDIIGCQHWFGLNSLYSTEPFASLQLAYLASIVCHELYEDRLPDPDAQSGFVLSCQVAWLEEQSITWLLRNKSPSFTDISSRKFQGPNYKKILRLSYDVIITYDNRKSNLR